MLQEPAGSFGFSLTDVQGTLFFADGGQLWKANDTGTGTQLVHSFLGVLGLDTLTDVNGTLFFAVLSAGSWSLWRSNGQDAFFVKELTIGARLELTNADGKLFFFTGNELWTSDLAGSTTHIHTFDEFQDGIPNPRLMGIGPRPTAVGGTLFFVVRYHVDNVIRHDLWKSNETTATLVKTAIGTDLMPMELTAVDNRLLFRGFISTSGVELWQSDGTDAGTGPILNIFPGLESSVPRDLFADSNGRLFFTAYDGVHGREAWIYSVRQDLDIDGVSASVEAGAPNGGDGNNDGILDSEQAEVTSLPNSADGSYVTLAAPDGTSLGGVAAISNPSPLDAPAVSFPIGHIDFTINGVAPGGVATVTIYLHAGATVDTYYKYGPTPDNSTPHWYEFLYDGTTGADIDNVSHTITLYFVDGHRGDNDLTANGQIVDPGSPACTPTQMVQIDVKPRDDTNSTNLGSQGVITVAILSTAGFNATLVDVSSVLFANARAVHHALEDVDRDGDVDLVLHFRIEDTILRSLYEQLVADDVNADGVLDSTKHQAEVSLTGHTADDTCFLGTDSLNLSLSGRALRDLLDQLAAAGAL
jgi:ELWxxDGT repeat protein